MISRRVKLRPTLEMYPPYHRYFHGLTADSEQLFLSGGHDLHREIREEVRNATYIHSILGNTERIVLLTHTQPTTAEARVGTRRDTTRCVERGVTDSSRESEKGFYRCDEEKKLKKMEQNNTQQCRHRKDKAREVNVQ